MRKLGLVFQLILPGEVEHVLFISSPDGIGQPTNRERLAFVANGGLIKAENFRGIPNAVGETDLAEQRRREFVQRGEGFIIRLAMIAWHYPVPPTPLFRVSNASSA